MALTTDQITFFQAHGYTVAPGFFSPEEARAMQLEIERFKRTGLVRNVATEGDGTTVSQTKRNLQLCPMFDKSDLFKALPFDPRVISAIKSLIGAPIRLHLDQVFLKPAKDGCGTNWHQDNAYFKLQNPMHGTAMWIAVHDATIANGTMEVIPDTFLENFEHTRDGGSDHHVRCYPDESTSTPIQIKAGGALFFCYGTPHCTRGNCTDSDRAGAAFHFLRTDANDGMYIKQWGAVKPGNPHLVGPLASDGVHEYGKRMSGLFVREVEAILDAETPIEI